MNKYQAIKTEVDGIKFDSKKEAQRYQELQLLQRAKKIKELQRQVPYVVIPKSIYGREIKYIADFVYYDCEKREYVTEDVKGMKLPIYKLKKRLVAEKYGVMIKEV